MCFDLFGYEPSDNKSNNIEIWKWNLIKVNAITKYTYRHFIEYTNIWLVEKFLSKWAVIY